MADAFKPVIIYRAVCNVTAKAYIGITIRTLRARRCKHFVDAQGGSRGAFHAAIRKYGRAAFVFEHIAACRTWEDACATEALLIATEGTLSPSGYNLTTGGDGAPGFSRPLDVRKKISNTMRAYFSDESASAETRRRMSEARTGMVFSEERKRKLSLAASRPESKAALVARMSDPAMKEKRLAALRAANTGKPLSAEHRDKLSRALRASPTFAAYNTRRKGMNANA